MDFELDDDQLSLQSAAADVLAKECPASLVRAVAEEGRDTTDLWNTLVSLDWPVLGVPVEDGGAGASTVELAIVLEQLGYAGDPTPFLATTTQFLPIVLRCGSPAQRADAVGAVASGAPGAVASGGVTASRQGDGWVLSGTASHVLDGDRASTIAVVAAVEGGSAVFVVPAAAVAVSAIPSFDAGLHVTDICLDGVTVSDDQRLPGSDLPGAAEEALAGLSVMTVGACQRALDITLDYVRSREQFGVPIGSFQAVKHKAVDMYVAIERARALAYFAAACLAESDERSALAASMAKAAAGDAQRISFQHGVQLHGAIGFTWENDLHLYLRRAKLGELLLGGAAHHRAMVGRMVMNEAAAARAAGIVVGTTRAAAGPKERRPES